MLERGGAGIVPALETGSVMVLESILHASQLPGRLFGRDGPALWPLNWCGLP